MRQELSNQVNNNDSKDTDDNARSAILVDENHCVNCCEDHKDDDVQIMMTKTEISFFIVKNG